MKCAVGKCIQNDGKKSAVSFYSFPKNNEEQRNLWIQFCNRKDTIKINRERICSLHFKQEDYERNIKYEMGFSNRVTLKLKPGAVPTIEAVEIKTVTLPCEEQEKKDKPDTSEDRLKIYVKHLEDEIDKLRKDNEMLTIQKKQSEITIKRLSQRVQKLSFSNANLEKALGRMFTEGQIKKIKSGDKRQNFTEADIADSIILYSTSAKAYRLLKRKNFPLPSIRTLQRWTQKSHVLDE